jgi:hypothetical protein
MDTVLRRSTALTATRRHRGLTPWHPARIRRREAIRG